MKSFNKYGFTNAMDGSEDNVLYEDSDMSETDSDDFRVVFF